MVRSVQNFGVLFLSVFALSACTTVSKLESSSQCEVWEEQGILPPRQVDLDGDSAKYKGRCSVMGMFLCSWVKADLDRQTKIVAAESNGLFNGRRDVGRYEKGVFTFDPGFMDNIVKSSPARVDRDALTVSRTVTLTALGLNQTSEQKVAFNKHCSSEQAAVGAVTLWIGKNKD